MSKTTWTARTKAQLVAALARKGWDRDDTRQLAEHAYQHGSASTSCSADATPPAIVGTVTHVLVVTFGDTEVDLWDAHVEPVEFVAVANGESCGHEHATFDEAYAAHAGGNADYITAKHEHTADVQTRVAAPFVADPANPTDQELADAIERGLASGQLIDAADWMAQDPEYAAAKAEHDAAGPDHATWCAGPATHLPIVLEEFATCGVCLARRPVDSLTRFGAEHVCQDCSPLELGRDACKVDAKHTVTHANGTTQVFRSPLASRGLGESAIGAFRWVAERASYGTYAPDGSSLGTYATPGEAFAVVRHNDGRYTLAGEAR